MVKFNLETANRLQIHGYATGHLTLAGVLATPGAQADDWDRETGLCRVTYSVLLHAEGMLQPWPVNQPDELLSEHFQLILEWQPEVLLLGTGSRLRFPEPTCLTSLQLQGIGVEVMDTAAACRTFNVLAAEGRRVAAALLMI